MLKNKINKEFLLINLGIFLVALDIHAFKTPNNFALGGTSGISILIKYFFPNASIGILMFLLNIILLIFGFICLGKKFAINTIYGSFLLSLIVWVLDVLFPIDTPLTNQKLMELIYSVFLPGIGNAIVFNYNSTTGGTDILGKIISKFFHLKISISMLILDFSIAICTGFLFGAETCLFSIMGVCFKSFVLDSFLENLHTFKIFVIVSSKSEEIKKFICNELKRGATVNNAKGAFTNEEKEIITTTVSRSQASLLQKFIKKTDPHAFITITNSSHIIGNGFGGFD